MAMACVPVSSRAEEFRGVNSGGSWVQNTPMSSPARRTPVDKNEARAP